MRRPRMAVVGAAVAALTTTAVIGGHVEVASATPLPPALAPVGAAVTGFEPQQSVDWHGCATGPNDAEGSLLEEVGAECGEVTVPVDYRKPTGPTLKIAISRLKAGDDSQRRGVLLLNPGGPGGSGLAMPVIAKAAPAVGASYDTVGFDPRFVGRSSGIDCAWPVSTVLRGAGPTKRTFTKQVAFARELASLCAGSRNVLPYTSTRNVARDMDLIRVALGEQKISYLGYSYGTYLGSVYLQMYPKQVDRFVLDSNVDPTTYGPTLFASSGPAVNAALKNWATWTAKRNSVYRLGTTPKQVLANIGVIRKAADKRPLAVGSYTVDYSLLPQLLWVADDSIQSLTEQSKMVKVLLAAAKGKDVEPTEALAQALEVLDSPAGSPMMSEQTAVLCSDRAASRTVSTYLKNIERHRKADPLFAPLIYNLGPCAFWPTKPLESPTKIHNALPVLMLNSTGDTQTPYAGARNLHKSLTGSRLVSLRSAFRHGLFLSGGSDCIDRAVITYLVDGKLPGRDLVCTTDRATGAPTGLSLLSTVPLAPNPVTTRTWPWQQKNWL